MMTLLELQQIELTLYRCNLNIAHEGQVVITRSVQDREDREGVNFGNKQFLLPFKKQIFLSFSNRVHSEKINEGI